MGGAFTREAPRGKKTLPQFLVAHRGYRRRPRVAALPCEIAGDRGVMGAKKPPMQRARARHQVVEVGMTDSHSALDSPGSWHHLSWGYMVGVGHSDRIRKKQSTRNRAFGRPEGAGDSDCWQGPMEDTGGKFKAYPGTPFTCL